MSRQDRNHSAESQCLGKEQFVSPGLATDVCRRRLRSKKHRGKLDRNLSTYRCSHCGHWHIGGRGDPK